VKICGHLLPRLIVCWWVGEWLPCLGGSQCKILLNDNFSSCFGTWFYWMNKYQTSQLVTEHEFFLSKTRALCDSQVSTNEIQLVVLWWIIRESSWHKVRNFTHPPYSQSCSSHDRKHVEHERLLYCRLTWLYSEALINFFYDFTSSEAEPCAC